MTRRVGSKEENTRELTIAAAKIENEAELWVEKRSSRL